MRAVSGLIVCLAVGLVTACSDPLQRRDAHVARGDQYISEHKYAEAAVEYGSAVQADPKSGIALEKLGTTYVELGDLARAFPHLVRAADLLPDNRELQLRAGRILLLAGRFDDARVRADKVLEKDPRSIDALILKGNALAGLRNFAEAITEVNKAIETDPTRGAGYAHLGNIQSAKGDVNQAEAAFKRAIAADPKSTDARLALANLYVSSGRPFEAEQQIKAAAETDPTSLAAQQALATLYLGTRRTKEAEAPLKVIASRSEGFQGKLMLADYYASAQRIDEARLLYEEISNRSDAGGPKGKLRLAALGLFRGDRSGAYRLIEEILAKDPRNVEALVSKAQLLFADGKSDEALAAARLATGAGQTSAMAYHVLGTILKSQNQFTDAEAAYKESARVSPRFAPAYAELAKLAIMGGRFSEAVTYAQTAIDSVPGYSEGYLLLAKAQLAQGNPKAAEQPLNLLAKNFPQSPSVLAEVGTLRLAKGDLTGAAQMYGQALALDPGQQVALEGITVVDVRQGRRDAARRRLDQAASAAPKNSDVQLTAARAYALTFSDFSASEAAVKQALDANPNNMAAYDLLARLYVQRGDLAASTTTYEKLAAMQPKSVGVQTAIGLLYYLRHDVEKAKVAYQRALALDPQAAVAANNLAGIYGDENQNLDVALQLAQTAKRGLPNVHEVDDTLGWLYYKKGMGSQAVSSLKAAVAAQPENALYLYHLGAAYALNKDRTNARQALEKALSKGNFDGAADARRVLESLK